MTTFKIIGKTKNLFVSETVRKILGLATIAITVRFGVMVMVYGLLVYSIVDVIISSVFLNRCIGIGIISQLKESLTPVVFSVIAGAGCWLVSTLISSLYIRFTVCILVFAGLYAVLSAIFKEQGIVFLKNYFK